MSRLQLTDSEREMVRRMIEHYRSHAQRCDNIQNRTMAMKQAAWDLERVHLLEKVLAASEPRKKGARQTTGRFDSRAELEAHIWYLWTETKAKQADIARACRVSETTVANILKAGNPCAPEKPGAD